MALFGFGKKKSEDKKPVCACQSGCPTSQIDEKNLDNLCSSDSLTIKVLGTGCTSCHTLLENTKEAVKNMGLSTDVEYVQDMAKIASYGVMSVPALVVNEKPVTIGKVLKTNEVEALLKKLGL